VPSQTHDRETAAACQNSGPIITMADPVTSVGLGILWLGVRLRSSPTDIFGQVASVLLMAAGIVITAHHAPPAFG
jgi:phosphomannomutase